MAIRKIQLPDNTTIDINDSRLHVYRTTTGTAAITSSPYYCSRWDVSDSTVTEYVDGMIVCLEVPVAGNGTYGTGFQINNLGYKPVVYNVNSMVSTRYGVGSVVWAVYNATQTGNLYINSGSASTVTGCWQVMDYDSNTTSIYNLIYYRGTRICAADVRRYILCVFPDETTIIPLNSTAGTGNAGSTATTKTMTTGTFDPLKGIVYYTTNAIVTSGNTIAMSTMYRQYNSVDLRYSFNCGTTSFTANSEVYMVMDLQSDGRLCKLASTPYSDTLPSTNDGHLYMLLGFAYSKYQIELYPIHPIYYHDGTSLKEWGNFSGNYNDLSNKPIIPSAISDLSDVTLTSVGDNQIITYDNTNSIWKNATFNSAISTLTSPVRIWDLDAGIYILPDNCVLYYDGSTSTSSITVNASLLTVVQGTSKKWSLWSGSLTPSIHTYGYTGSGGGQYVSKEYSSRSSTSNASYDLGVRNRNNVANLNVVCADFLCNGWCMGNINKSTDNIPSGMSGSGTTYYLMKVCSARNINVYAPLDIFDIRQDIYFPIENKHYYRIIKYYNNTVTPNTSIPNADANGWVEVVDTYPALTNNAGKVLTVNSNADGVEWTTPSGGGSSTLSALTDTTISSPADNQILKYDNATSKWVNADVPTELPAIIGNANKILAVNNGATGVEWITNSGGGGLTNYDFTHTANQSVSGSVTVTFAADTKGSRMVSTTADLSVSLVVNNEAENILWVKNTGTSDIDVIINSVTHNNSSVSSFNIHAPNDGITVKAGLVAEIGIVVNSDGAFITTYTSLT